MPPLSLIRLFHRSDNGHVSFGRKLADRWEDLFSVPADCLDSLPPEAVRLLGRDAYFTINSSYRGGHWRSRQVPELLHPLRGAKNLGYLNAVYADLDCRNVGLSDGETIGRLIEIQDRGEVPPPSLLARSGRGVWVYWLLADPATGQPPKSSGANRRHYAAIMRGVNLKLAALGADGSAVDASRLTRVPASVHTGSQNVVRYCPQLDSSGQPFLYSLGQLASALCIVPRPRPVRRERPPRQQGSWKGWRAINRERLARFIHLIEHRGGVPEGQRETVVWVYSSLVGAVAPDAASVERELTDFNDEWCDPPLPPSEVREKAKRAATFKLKNQTIADRLAVTPDEAEAVGLPPASLLARPKESRKQIRQRMIGELTAAAGGERLSTRKMVKLLTDAGVKADHSTVSRDYLQMGFTAPLTPHPLPIPKQTPRPPVLLSG